MVMTRSPLAFTLALTFAVGLAPAASAQAPAAGTLLTGGSVGTGSPQAFDLGNSEIGIRVLSGPRVRVRSVNYIGCGSSRTSETSGYGTAGVNPDGSFRVVLRRGRQLESRGFRRSIVVTGRLAGDQATGKIASTSRFGRRRCRGSVDWTARTARTVGTDAAPVPAGAVLLGRTSGVRNGPFGFNLRVSPDGRRVVKTVTSFQTRCRKIKPYEETNIGPSITIKPDGTFRKTERFKMGFADVIDTTTLVVTGRFVAGGARGTLRARTVSRSRRTKRVTDRCTTGTLRWSAAP
jgi:hypothetical protein